MKDTGLLRTCMRGEGLGRTHAPASERKDLDERTLLRQSDYPVSEDQRDIDEGFVAEYVKPFRYNTLLVASPTLSPAALARALYDDDKIKPSSLGDDLNSRR